MSRNLGWMFQWMRSIKSVVVYFINLNARLCSQNSFLCERIQLTFDLLREAMFQTGRRREEEERREESDPKRERERTRW